MKLPALTAAAFAAYVSNASMTPYREATWPDAIADSLSSDGAGHIDLGYKYHASSFPKTSRMVCELYDGNWGKGRAPGPTIDGTYPRTVFGYQDSSSSSRSIVRYNGGKGEFVYNGGEVRKDCGRLDTIITNDYINACGSWKYMESPGLLLEYENIVAPSQDATCSYYLFANHVYSGQNLWKGIFSFKNLKVYEMPETGDEILVRDYIPCKDAGKFGVYDKVTHGIFHVVDDTNAFSVANLRWRLTVTNEVLFLPAGQAQNFSAPAGSLPDGWFLVNDRDAAVIASGRGSEASFGMPEAGATLVWGQDVTVAAGTAYTVVAPMCSTRLVLGPEATLSFREGATITIPGNPSLPENGVVTISCPNLSAAGVYGLVYGVSDTIDVSRFVVGNLPSGLSGAVERHGSALCLRVSGTSDGFANLPDRILDTVSADGCGYIDLGYKYHMSSFPKTSRMVCELNDRYWGCGRSPGPTIPDTFPRTVFGYLESDSSSRSIARYNGSKAEFVHNGGEKRDYCGRYDTTIIIDYLNACASWHYSEGSGKTLEYTDVTAPSKDADRTYYLFADNTHDGTSSWKGIFDFKNLRVYEQTLSGEEVLVRNYLPAMKNGNYGIYDAQTRDMFYIVEHTNGCVSTGVPSWPSTVYSVVTQEFTHVFTSSKIPVVTPEFAPETSYVFKSDGHVVMRDSVDSATVKSYDAKGDILHEEELGSLETGAAIEIAIGTAYSVVLALDGIAVSADTVAQDFVVASTVSGNSVLFRQTGKYNCEFMISAASTFSFKTGVNEISADSYDSSGELLGTDMICGHVSAGRPVVCFIGDGTSYKILHVALSRPPFTISIR